MTAKQRFKLYFPAWARACKANDWHMVKGRLVGQKAESYGPPEVNALYQRIWIEALKRALQAHSCAVADDLRHACHIVALGQDKSSNDLTNAEVDRVVAIFRLLADENDIDALITLDHPERGERQRLVIGIKKMAPEAKLIAIAKNLKTWAGEWEIPFWEDMPIEALRLLNRIVHE